MVTLNKKDRTIIVAGAIVAYFAPSIIEALLGALPNMINWVVQNIVLVGIIGLVVYLSKKK